MFSISVILVSITVWCVQSSCRNSRNPRMESPVGCCGVCGLSGPLPAIEAHFMSTHVEEEQPQQTEQETPSPKDLANENTQGKPEARRGEKMWTQENTLFLLDLVKSHDEEFSNSVKKNVWKKIGQICQQHNKDMTANDCETKFKALKRTYKSILLHNNTSGQRKRHWEYFTKMHDFMHKKPEINPLAVCSSSAGLIVSGANKENNDNQAVQLQPEMDNNQEGHESSFSRKRKLKENKSELRHNEKMAKLDRFNDLFEKMVNKM